MNDQTTLLMNPRTITKYFTSFHRYQRNNAFTIGLQIVVCTDSDFKSVSKVVHIVGVRQGKTDQVKITQRRLTWTFLQGTSGYRLEKHDEINISRLSLSESYREDK